MLPGIVTVIVVPVDGELKKRRAPYVNSPFLHPVDTKMPVHYARSDPRIETFAVVTDPKLEIFKC